MPRRAKLSWLDMALVLIMIVLGVVALSTSRANTDAQRQKTKLETNLNTAESNLSQAEKEVVDLSSLRRALREAEQAARENPFPVEMMVVGLNIDIWESAEANNVAIVTWNYNYASMVIRGRTYPMVRHSLAVEGKPERLIKFIAGFAYTEVTPVIQSMQITLASAENDIWRLVMELVVYHR